MNHCISYICTYIYKYILVPSLGVINYYRAVKTICHKIRKLINLLIDKFEVSMLKTK